jgi:dATP/dGTP diphosphohydrolase, N-terminal
LETLKMSKSYTEVKDSGLPRTEYETGAVRDVQEGKGRFDLIPPEPLFRLAKHYENGARKYAARNWEKGIPLSRYLDSAFRHLVKVNAKMDDEDHEAAVIWNMFGFIQTKKWIEEGKLPKELNDL